MMDFALSPEQRRFADELREWVDREIPKDYARDAERADRYPLELFEKLAAAGYHGTSVAREYGGQGGDNVTQMLLARGLGRSLAGLTWVWGSTSFTGANSIGLYGSPEQKERFLPAIARGELRFTIGFTEPGGSTDLVGGMRTTARRADGGWVVNGEKAWCCAARDSHYVLLIAITDPDSAKRHHGLSLFLLPTDSEGLSMTAVESLGQRSLGNWDLTLEDVFIPGDLAIGEPNHAWQMMLPTLNYERLMLLGLCCGILDGVLEDALAYAGERHTFGRPIGQYQAVQHHIAEIAMARRQTELVALHAAWLDLVESPDAFLELTMAKVIATEHCTRAADLGIQVLGGAGYSAETHMQRYWRDSRLYRMSPVTNEMARNLVAERLGLPRSF
jgi:acyl-CoA dehydrogenase